MDGMASPTRIRLRRTKSWRKPAGAVVVARPTRWGNPFAFDRYRDDADPQPKDVLRARAVAEFRRELLAGRLDGYPGMDEIRAELAGRDLACWCPEDQPCHGDILLEIANAPL
jgi:uncharacterized protein DUF4326